MVERVSRGPDTMDISASKYEAIVAKSALYPITSKLLKSTTLDSGLVKSIISDLIINFVRLSIQRIETTIQKRTEAMLAAEDYVLIDLCDKAVKLFERIGAFEQKALAWKIEVDASLHVDHDFNAGLLIAEDISHQKMKLRELTKIQNLAKDMRSLARASDVQNLCQNGKALPIPEGDRQQRAGHSLSEFMGPIEEMVERFLRAFIANPGQATEMLCDGQTFSQVRLSRGGENLTPQQAMQIYTEIEAFKKTETFQSIAQQAQSMSSLFLTIVSPKSDDDAQEPQNLDSHDWWADGTQFEDYIERIFANELKARLKAIRADLNELAGQTTSSNFKLPSEITTLLLEVQQDYYDLNNPDRRELTIHDLMEGAAKLAVGQTVQLLKLQADQIRGFAHCLGDVAKLFPLSQKIMSLVDPEEDIGFLPAPFLYHAAFKDETGSVLSRAVVAEGQAMRRHVHEVVFEERDLAPSPKNEGERLETARAYFHKFKASTKAYSLLLQRKDDEFTRDVLNAMRWEVIGSQKSPGVPVVAAELFQQGKFAIPERSLTNLKEQFEDEKETVAFKRDVLIRAKLTDIMLHLLANAPNLDMFAEALAYFVPDSDPAEKRAKGQEVFLGQLKATVIEDVSEANEEYVKRSDAMKELSRTFSISLARAQRANLKKSSRSK